MSRQDIERAIASQCINDLHNAGYNITVNDGEDDVVENSLDHNEVLDAMFSTDEDYLIVFLPGQAIRSGWVRFIYGNDGWDVINDYTVNLEGALATTIALGDRLEREQG